MRDWVSAYIGLGANLGNPVAALQKAMTQIAGFDNTVLTRQSPLYGSAPVDSGGPDYVNAVIEVHTRLSAPQLLIQLQAVENTLGRQRPYRNAPRTLDLDILLYGEAQISSATLVVPHPRMTLRAFVLRPLGDIAPERVDAACLQRVANQALWPFKQ